MLAWTQASRVKWHFIAPGKPMQNGICEATDLATQDALHPVVFRHPSTSRRALYVSPGFTVRVEGWTASESAPLLGFLYETVVREAYQFRLVWREGTLAIWDNRTTWHKAENDYQGERRLMHRVTVAGLPLDNFDEETG